MDRKELKKLSRAQLLELLIALAKENRQLKERLEEAEKKLEDKEIATKEAGSIAQASLQLNNVFEAAQSAADQYIENIRRMESEQEEICRRLKETEKQLEEERLRQAQAAAEAAEAELAKNPPEESKPEKGGFFSFLKRRKVGDDSE